MSLFPYLSSGSSIEDVHGATATAMDLPGGDSFHQRYRLGVLRQQEQPLTRPFVVDSDVIDIWSNAPTVSIHKSTQIEK